MLADEPRDLVVLGLIAERAGQAAAAGVEVDHFRPRDTTQEAEQRAHPDERSLMAVALDEDPLRARAEREPGRVRAVGQERFQALLDRQAGRRDGLGAGALLATE